MPGKRKAARQFQKRGVLTAAQYEDLLHGFRLISGKDEPGFGSETDARAAWGINRAELMAAAAPGRRPAAYYRFDLDEQHAPGRWSQEIEFLERAGLIGPEELLRIEKTYGALSVNQEITFYEPAGLHTLSVEVMRHTRDEWRFVAGWHSRRNRPELTIMFERRAACLDGWLAEREKT